MDRFSISYPEFRLGEIIDPDEANTNNADIVGQINELIENFNSLVGDGEGGVVELNIRGNIVTINPIAPFKSTTLEDFLVEFTNRLYSSNGGGLSGAGLIGAEEIRGLRGTTVQEQLISLYNYLNTAIEGIEANINTDGSIAVSKLRVLERDPVGASIGEIWLLDD